MILYKRQAFYTEDDMKNVRWHRPSIDTYLREKEEYHNTCKGITLACGVVAFVIIGLAIWGMGVISPRLGGNELTSFMSSISRTLWVSVGLLCILCVGLLIWEWYDENKHGPNRSAYGTFQIINKSVPIRAGMHGREYVPLSVIDVYTKYQTTLYTEDWNYDELQVGMILEIKVTESLMVDKQGEVGKVTFDQFKF